MPVTENCNFLICSHKMVLLALTLCIFLSFAFGFNSECDSVISSDDIEFYKENGYLMIPKVLNSLDLSKMQQSYQRLFDRRLSEGDELQGTWKGDWDKKIDAAEKGKKKKKRKLYSIHDVEYFDNVFSKYILFNDKIGCFLELGTNSSNVLLHHTKAHTKPAISGAAFPPHQDYQYFPYEQHSMVAIFVHLDDTTKENGGLIIWPKSQNNGPQYDQGWNDGTGYHYLNISQYPFESGQSVIANAGDAVMFSYLTIHASYPNKSERNRRMVLIQAVAAEDKPLSMIHRHSKGQGIVLRGINPNLKQTSHYKRHEAESDIIKEETKTKIEL